MIGSQRFANSGERCPRAAPTLTVIVPVFNEAPTLSEAIRQVLHETTDKQVLVVDDCSTDGTVELLERWEAQTPIEVLRHNENRGKGAAIRTALPFARGRFTIIQDGDLELSPSDYPRLLAPLLTGAAEFVIGSRERPSQRPSLARAGVALLNVSVRLLYGARLTDEACCYKVLRTDILRAMNLQCERFEFCPEVVAKACRLGLRIQEVPVRYQPRCAFNGKKLRSRDGVAALWRWRHWTPEDFRLKRTAFVARDAPAAGPLQAPTTLKSI